MQLNRALRALLISTILILGSLLSMLIIVPTVGAESITGETTFYFKNALSLNFEDVTDLYIVPVSQEIPTKQNDSKYPPSLLRKNTSKPLKRELNTNELFYWMAYWTLSLFEEFDGNFTDGIGDFFKDFEILFPNPFRIVEIFEYNGNETLEIDGDVFYDLYFSSLNRPIKRQEKFRDEVKVGLYKMGILFPKEIKNITQQIKPSSLLINGISKQKIILENVNLTLNPGESLLFSIELIQRNKSGIISSFFQNFIKEEKFLNRWEKRGNLLENMSKFTILQDLGSLIKEIMPFVEELNFTIEDIVKFIDTFRSSSLVYDSEAHPSSVTMDFILPGESENIKRYYLHNEYIMDTNEPTEGKHQNIKLSDTQINWVGQNLDDRNKIIKDVSVDLFIKCPRLGDPSNIQVAVALFDGDNEIPIDPVIKSLDKSNKNPQNPTTFTFEDVNYELDFGHGLSIGVALVNAIKLGRIRKVELLYDSNEKPSSVKVIFSETDNIKFDYISDPNDGLIIPGGSIKYTLSITSKNDDDISVDVLDEKEGDWSIKGRPEQLEISAGGTAITNIFVNSTNNKKEAYGDLIDMTFVISGKTGIDRKTVSAGVSENAIQYDVKIVNYTQSKYIDKGKNGTFNFIIQNKNTGAKDDVDSYTINAKSKNNWDIDNTDYIRDLKIDEKTGSEEIIVIVSVPKNTTLKSDTITFTVTSDNGDASAEVNVTVEILDQGILDSIYDFFESTSNSLGLNEIFGTYAPIALVSILMIIILFIIIILSLLLTRKFINIICTERIQEIDPNEKATFKITLENPSRKSQFYNISTDRNPLSPKWEKFVETKKIRLDNHQTKTILLTVKPTEYAEPNDWTETKFKVNILGKRKTEEITTMTLLKTGKSLLKITDVFTWPKEFKKGDRIITSFKLENKGSISAKNVKTVLLINGKEKNKVEITIPSGGYADIKMPWIALKGKNNLHIKAIEQ